MEIKPIRFQNGKLLLIDQRKLPAVHEIIETDQMEEAIAAIRNMAVRGAPAIAITGLYAAVLYLQKQEKPSYGDFCQAVAKILDSRPTAVNLSIALGQLHETISEDFYNTSPLSDIYSAALRLADQTAEEDVRQNRMLAANGLRLFGKPRSISILTHCNTGALATAGHGTALGMIRTLRDNGFDVTVYADETRPYLQGSRLTAWELQQEKIRYFIITDNMAGWLMAQGRVDAVIVGTDRIASNGDVANKIGTYSLSVLARHHNIPFYVAGTKSSFDMKISSGRDIVIEERPENEVLDYAFATEENGKPSLPPGKFAPPGSRAWNPAFDVTPASLVSAIITELGVVENPDREKISVMVHNG